ncbi:MAG TPA: SIR2 family protein [Solirubrobacterales bacterium]|nr:SIR2 family protein [Solirubrobacterales bacterium]
MADSSKPSDGAPPFGDLRADPETIERLLRPSTIAIPVVGAGVPISAELPGSPEIARHLIEQFDLGDEYPVDPAPLQKVVDDSLYGRDIDLEVSDAVRAYVRSWPKRSSPLLDNLSSVQSRFILTLNYDSSVEDTAEQRGEEVDSLGNTAVDLERALAILGGKRPPDKLTVVHLHGRAAGDEELVLNKGSYRRAENTVKENLVRELLLENRLFFFGTRLDEVQLQALIERVSDPKRRGPHLFFCLNDEVADLTEGRAALHPAGSNIYINPVETFDELAHCAGRLVDADPGTAKVEISTVAFDSERYVPNRLHDRRGPDPDDPATIAAAIRDGREEIVDALPEEELLASPRTIVLGEPGTGKTEMLRRLASSVREPRKAVLIRLADVSLNRRFGPKETVRAWAREGCAFQDVADFEVAALDQVPFHFFLDGLDEVPSDLQQEFAARISKCAAALPQHSFTLASRPLPSLDLLRVEGSVASDWEQLKLQPDEQWRESFLAVAQVTLEELYEQMPALEDLSEVTTTPFYLARIVKLSSEGRLDGLPDFSALLRALLDAAIAHEGEALGIDDGEARSWLRDVALAGTLAGRRTFSVEELERFALPAGVQAGRLARGLEQRLLLAEDGGSFRFHHRLLGEQLAAEALVEHGPLTGLLDALVPLIDRELSGVRPDASVPGALAALQNPDWRLALGERDPLAAARATPEGAAADEVEDAARTLWENAVKTQVWMWERGMQIADDADSAGRLLKAVRGCPLEKAVLDAARGRGTDQDRGNAITVLSRAEHPELEAILLEVLEAPDQNGVVLRQTVIAAERRRYLDLVDPIVTMLKREPDHLVHQVGIHILSRLVPREQLLKVFMELLGSSEASYAVAVALSQLAPGESLLLLAAFLAGEEGDEDGRDLTGRRSVERVFERLDLTELDRSELVAAIDVFLRLRLHSDRLEEIAEREPQLALQRLVELATEFDFGWWEVIDLAEHFTPDQLREAGAPEEIAARAEQRRAAWAEQEEVIEEQGEPAPVDLLDRTPSRDRVPPGLAELLSQEDSDAELQHRSEELSAEVEELDNSDLVELLARMETWWPGVPFIETITRKSEHEWSQQWPSAAWIRYAPKARPSLGAKRWGELAACGVLWDTQTQWLRSAYSVAGAYAGQASLEGVGEPDRWQQFLSCCQDPVPNPILLACADQLDAELPEDGNQHYNLRLLASRMLENGRRDLAEQIARRSEGFAALLEPLLAGDGDIPTQQKLVEKLKERLRDGGRPREDELRWLGGVVSEQLLAELFAILDENWKLDDRPVARVRSGYGLHDLFSPLQEAIARIGGREAIAGYDRLIAEGGDFRWLRASRERVAAAVLLADAQRFGPGAALTLGLPILDPEAGAVGR